MLTRWPNLATVGDFGQVGIYAKFSTQFAPSGEKLLMSSVDEKSLNEIAELARLAVDESESDALLRDLDAILGFVEQMDAVDTEGVEPMAHPLDVPQRLRADEVTESSHRELYQSVSPSHENGLYLVPKVID